MPQSEATDIVCELNAKKVPGSDNITNKVLKLLPAEIYYLFAFKKHSDVHTLREPSKNLIAEALILWTHSFLTWQKHFKKSGITA